MKKPKKSTAAKSRAPQAGSKTELRAKSAKAEAATEPGKARVKRVRKPTTAESVTPAEPAHAMKVQPQPESASKAKRPRTKADAKTEAAPEAAPVAKAKPASIAGLVAEAKTAETPAAHIPAPESGRTDRPARKVPSKIPPILLEGDKPTSPPASGPGERYALGPAAPVEKLQTEGELPTTYATGEVLLTARDPHWLYTHWDLSDDQQRRYNAFSRDGHLIVRVYIDAANGKPAAEIHVHPESRHWFIHVNRANTRYVAELGYYSAADKWTIISTSPATLTPPDAVSDDSTAEFATIPFEVPMQKLLSLVKEAVQENAPLAQAFQELRANGHPELPKIQPPSAARAADKSPSRPWKPSTWTAAQERALAQVISMDHVRRVWMGSLEITELIRRQAIQEFGAVPGLELGGVAAGAPTSPMGEIGAVSGISSPGAKAAQPAKGFWFNVNAELIVYGATEADASVTIGGRKIKLRPDGSFSYRFALPDGKYEMPVVAISADETDGRAAEMKFSRSTEYRGHVGAHPQDPSLRQLLLENF